MARRVDSSIAGVNGATGHTDTCPSPPSPAHVRVGPTLLRATVVTWTQVERWSGASACVWANTSDWSPCACTAASGAINATAVVVRVPGCAELVEHQQQQDQPASQPLRRARRRGAHGRPGTKTGRTHGDGGLKMRLKNYSPHLRGPPGSPAPALCHCAPLIRTLSSLTELMNTSTSGPRWMKAAWMGPIQPINAAVMPSTCTTPTPTNRFSCTVR